MIEILGLVLLGLGAGALAATLGIGGGIIYVPVLVTAFGMAQLSAQATSIAIIVPTAIIATFGHHRADRVIWKVAVVAGTAGIVGALLGVQIAYRLDEDVLRRVFAVVLALLAARMAYHSWAMRPGSSSTDTG